MLKLCHKADLSTLVLAGIIMSFVGWLYEVCLFIFLYGGYYDRGFVTLPLCPIYGITLIVIYILIGTPQGGGLLLLKLPCGGARVLIYFIFASFIPALSEFIGGEVMERISGEVLWSYESYRYTVGKYACLEIALLWGILILTVMCFFDKLIALLNKIPRDIAKRLAISLFALGAFDFLGNILVSIYV